MKVIWKQTCILFSSFLMKENLKQKTREREKKQTLAQQVHYYPFKESAIFTQISAAVRYNQN